VSITKQARDLPNCQ